MQNEMTWCIEMSLGRPLAARIDSVIIFLFILAAVNGNESQFRLLSSYLAKHPGPTASTDDGRVTDSIPQRENASSFNLVTWQPGANRTWTSIQALSQKGVDESRY
jgi:hypothetical protein